MNRPPLYTDRKSRLIAMCVTLVLAIGGGTGGASAADRATCKAIAGLLKATDNGLEDAALGRAGQSPTNGIATYARQAQDFADQFSMRDPLPEDVSAALSVMAEAASAHVFIADAAPAILEPALFIQRAMPQICKDTVIPDLGRHDKG